MRALWFTFAIVLVDQVTKVIVKATMLPGESIPVIGDFLKWTFTENPGMAFGFELWDGEPIGKLALSVFSVVATILIFFYLRHVRESPAGYRISLALILGGAIGNVIDRVFYGVFWEYGHIFFGNVVDFIHFDIWRGFVPDSVPILGGKYLSIFPIGNIADLAIIAGVVGVLWTQKAFQSYVQELHAPPLAPEALSAELPVDVDTPDDVLTSEPTPSEESTEPTLPSATADTNGTVTPDETVPVRPQDDPTPPPAA